MPVCPRDHPLCQHRAERRRALAARTRAAVQSGRAAATFALLVLPVDFADDRFPAPEADRRALVDRLEGTTPGSLLHYFTAASGGRLDLHIVLGPVVHLAGSRRDYSDRDLQGHHRSRALAREALQRAVADGLDLRLADNDGPDGLPASGDDDGRVDGVLILHAAPGLENAPDTGWIQPLQADLPEPVTGHGVAADVYAVAAARSGVGIWAHETGHLLGLEDRYDPFLPAGEGETAARGGLGRFSLMAAGALGSGRGDDPALPDAYSAAALGWVTPQPLVRPLPADLLLPWRGDAGTVWRLDGPGGEYFLLEARGGATPPYDAAVPSGLLIYHVDPAVPEGGQSSSDPDTRHLRVTLVEADGDGALAAGEDTGSAGDPFPGSLARVRWGPDTAPSSDGYAGPSGIVLDGIAVGAAGVTARATVPGHPFQWMAAFQETPAGTTLAFTAWATAPLPAGEAPALALIPMNPGLAWGHFTTADGTLAVSLVPADTGGWVLPMPVRWRPNPGLPAGATTLFLVHLTAPSLPTIQQEQWLWQWRDTTNILSLSGSWQQRWQVTGQGDPGTTWQRWLVQEAGPLPPGPLLACTAPAAADGTDWPAVTYSNHADAVLVSGPFRGAGTWLRLVHWVDLDTVHAGRGGDGAAAAVVTDRGDTLALVPVGGYPGRVDPRTGSALAGAPAWTGTGPRNDGGGPLWREDLLPLPEPVAGWCRLVLRLASDRAWRGAGWLVRSVARVPAGRQPFRLHPTGDGRWTAAWTADDSLLALRLEGSPDGRSQWFPLVTATGPVVTSPPRAGHDAGSLWLRAVAELAWGAVGTPPVPASRLAPDRSPLRLAARPGHGTVRFTLEAPDPSRLELFDLRGHRVWSRRYPGGTFLETWPGTDTGGRRVPAGLYLGRLRTARREAHCRFLLVR